MFPFPTLFAYTDEPTGLFAAFGFMSFISLVCCIAAIVGLWKTFEKAGQPGWAAIIPIYNIIVMLEVVNRPLWWIVLMFIPFVNIVISILVILRLAESFSKSTAFAVGLIFLSPVFLPMLGFDSSVYSRLPE